MYVNLDVSVPFLLSVFLVPAGIPQKFFIDFCVRSCRMLIKLNVTEISSVYKLKIKCAKLL